jgi:chloramphenicol-sensitive protein RarD
MIGEESRSAAASWGVLYGIAAYGTWGFFPLYFKAVAAVSPAVVMAHRAVWSFVVLAVLVAALGRWKELWHRLRDRQLLLKLVLSTLLIAANWLTFIYAVASAQVLQASLGYFINPLVNVLLGVVLLGERLRPRQAMSIALALLGVLVLAVFVGEVPWLALTMALTFSLYSLMRKIMPVDAVTSLTVETMVMAPAALAYLGCVAAAGGGGPLDPRMLGLLILGGPVTTVPLLLFGAAARRLRLATLGILQYLSPTLQFSLAVLAFGEPFSTVQLVSFACIWAAVLIYAADSLTAPRPERVAVLEPD